MKRLILFAITFLSLNAIAQEKKAKVATLKKEMNVTSQSNQAEALANKETKKLTKQLELSTKQQTEVQAIMLSHFKKHLKEKQKIKQTLISKENTNKKELKDSVKKIKQNQVSELDTKLKNILTPEQYKTYQEINIRQEKANQKVRRKKS